MKIIITESQIKLLEMKTSIRRRYLEIKDFILNLMDSMYVCEYDNEEHFMQGVLHNAEDYYRDFDDFSDMGIDEFLESLEDVFSNEIYSYYDKHCSEESDDDLDDSFYGSVEETNFVVGDLLTEAEYQGRKVTLNKPFLTPKGPKKRSVYVKNEKGNVVKVNFGDPNMKIKAYSPKHRKSFRARHNCKNPGPKTGAKFWSCRQW